MEPEKNHPDILEDQFAKPPPPPSSPPDESDSPEYRPEAEDIVQVVYQSGQDGGLVGISSQLLPANLTQTLISARAEPFAQTDLPGLQLRALTSVAEETNINQTSSSSNYQHDSDPPLESILDQTPLESELECLTSQYESHDQPMQYFATQTADPSQAIYSTVNKRRAELSSTPYDSDAPVYTYSGEETSDSLQLGFYSGDSTTEQLTVVPSNVANDPHTSVPYSDTSTLRAEQIFTDDQLLPEDGSNSLVRQDRVNQTNEEQELELQPEIERPIHFEDREDDADDEEIGSIKSRQHTGAAESGSFRNNFKKKLGISFSTNENDLGLHRHKFLQSQDGNSVELNESTEADESNDSKFKRTHSVSFNVGSTRSGRLSVDIRNLPSYLTVKRASIVDVAKGAMSSLMHSFGSSSSAGFSSNRRDSSADEEPIFEEPIAPTLSLGQRVAMVRNNGTEFGTVGWIGQLPGFDDDWIVGVVFDNMIGDCDGAYNGVRYFYSRENYAMFVPLSVLTKTDNYIGRPETGTMLSRMSISLKPGQLISIQRSNLRLQHCFLNAPHQRVGHDVRAVSNRLHCQCHNCGPCAHLTKQDRLSHIPPMVPHHAPNKKNSLAHAAVELLAHHHHHYHDEGAHEPEDYQFGDNAAHACNFVRYSCCQQSGAPGHDFSADCGLVRPELLDNLIHAPRAPHRRSRLRRRTQPQEGEKSKDYLPDPIEGQPLETELETDKSIEATKEAAVDSTYSSRSSSPSSQSYSSQDEARNQFNSDLTYRQGAYHDGNSQYTTMDSCVSIREQQRFISQRDSSAFVRSSYSEGEYYFVSNRSSGLGASIRRCFGCLFKNQARSEASRSGSTKSSRRRKRRKLSIRNKALEYQRRQSSFIPSTLAKPQEDFASHGIFLPPPQELNADFSGYSRSFSGSPSSFEAGSQYDYDNRSALASGEEQNPHNQRIATSTSYRMGTNHEEPLKSPNLYREVVFDDDNSAGLNYDDYTFSEGSKTYKKEGFSRESVFTDLGYFDSMGNSSNDTLKQIIDDEINQQEALPEPSQVVELSPLSWRQDELSERAVDIEISSPTITEEQDLSQKLNELDFG